MSKVQGQNSKTSKSKTNKEPVDPLKDLQKSMEKQRKIWNNNFLEYVKTGNIKKLEYMLNPVDIEKQVVQPIGDDGLSPIFVAIKSNKPKVVELLLKTHRNAVMNSTTTVSIDGKEAKLNPLQYAVYEDSKSSIL